MKRIIPLCLALIMTVGLLAGCGKQNEQTASDETRLRVVTTIFPEYDWVREILGDKADNAEVTMLLDNGADLHSYQPTADDIIKISECDLFIYVGGESDDWVDDALKNAANKNMKVINLLEALGDSVKTEEAVEGMQEEEHDHDHDHEDADEHDDAKEHDHEEEAEYDEHVWLSLKNAQTLCSAISAVLQQIDPDNKDTYAAFAGCSAESEASFETISFLAGKVDELNLPCVLTIEGVQHKIAETIVRNTAAKNQKVLTMDSMQSTTSKDAANGTTYLSVMERNLSVLKEALG